jgi:hypothetical protein
MRTGRVVKLDAFKKSKRPGRKQEKRKPAIKEPELVEVESPHD